MNQTNPLRASMLLVIGLLFSSTLMAKDLTERFGLGFKNNTSQNLPSITGTYYAARTMAFTGGFGINTEKNNSAYQVNAGVRKMIFMETNLNFYVGAQAGIASYETLADGKNSGIELLGVFGAEFFLSGLENLAFTFEAGAGMSSAKEARFRTVGDDPFRAGVVFYF